MKKAVKAAIAVAAVSLCVGCIPWIEDVSGMPNREQGIETDLFARSESVLVWTVWYDNGRHNVRNPFILEARELPNLSTHLGSRHRLGLMWFDAHGPSHSRGISGFFVFGSKKLLWYYWREDQRSLSFDQTLRAELVEDLSAGGVLSTLKELCHGNDILSCDDPIRFRGDRSALQESIDFLAGQN